MYLATSHILNTTLSPKEKLFLAHYMLINKLSGIDWSYQWCSSEVGFSIKFFQMLTNYPWSVTPD